MTFASVEELKNLAENWCYENLRGQSDYDHRGLEQIATEAYTAGYDQALEDLRSELR